MVALPLLAYELLPAPLPIPGALRIVGGGALFVGGVGLWSVCLDHFSRRGRGTPFPLDAPRELVTTGPFALIRNPIMAAELSVIWGEVLYFGALGIALYALLATLAGRLGRHSRRGAGAVRTLQCGIRSLPPARAALGSRSAALRVGFQPRGGR